MMWQGEPQVSGLFWGMMRRGGPQVSGLFFRHDAVSWSKVVCLVTDLAHALLKALSMKGFNVMRAATEGGVGDECREP